MNDEFERPLGQDVKTRGGRARLGLSRGAVAAALASLAVVAVSAAIALSPKPFRKPPEAAVVTTPEPAKAAPPAAAGTGAPVQPPAAEAAAKAPDGPAIIRVDPDRVGPDQPAAGGAIVVRDPSALHQNLRVAHLPDRALIEYSEAGPLPIRSADGKRPMDVYARPWSGARGARVAIVIGGLGLSQTGTQAAINKLPGEVTLAFAPRGNSLMRWMQQARQSGHEIVMQVPLEPFDYPNVNPGRNTLTVEASPERNLGDLRWALSRITNYTGVMNYMGARFVTDEAAMEPLMAELSRRGLLYLDDGTSARSVAAELARKERVPFAVGDAVIDLVRDRGEILKKLDQVEATARAKGTAVATGSAFDVTVDAVAAWVEEVKRRGVEVVPVSAVVDDPERR